MGLETGDFIDDLNASNPVGASDPKSQGDDHIRLIKKTILASFPNITGAMTLTHTQINDAARKSASNTFTEQQIISNANARLIFIETDASADNGRWKLSANAEQFTIDLQNDAGAVSTNAIIIKRTGTAVDDILLKSSYTSVMGGGVLRVYDSGNTDYIEVKHSGTDVVMTAVNTADLSIAGLAGNVWIRDGAGLKISDSSDADSVTISHSGTDLDLSFVNTTDLNIRDGVITKFFESADVKHVAISHNGSDGILSVSSGDLRIQTLDNIRLDSTYGAFGGADFVIGVQPGEAGKRLTFYDYQNARAMATWDLDAKTFNSYGNTVVTDNGSASEPGYKGAPQTVKNISYTLVLADAGTQIYKASGGAGETITIPANAAVAFSIGTIIEIINDGGGDLSIAITTDTLEKFGGSAGTQTLTDNNKAVIEKVTATLWKYSSSD